MSRADDKGLSSENWVTVLVVDHPHRSSDFESEVVNFSSTSGFTSISVLRVREFLRKSSLRSSQLNQPFLEGQTS